jgi:hypothetical protein
MAPTIGIDSGAAKSTISFLFNYYSQKVKPCGLERVTILCLVFELESRGPWDLMWFLCALLIDQLERGKFWKC